MNPFTGIFRLAFELARQLTAPVALACCLAVAAAEKPEAPSPAAAKPDSADDVELQAGQKIGFAIREDPARDGTLSELLVSPTGFVEFPVSRKSGIKIPLDVGGKKVSEVKTLLKAKLDEDYYVNATIELVASREQEAKKAGLVYLYGKGVKSQIVQLLPGEPHRILDVILTASTTEFANLKKVKLMRKNAQTGKVETTVINVEEIKKTGNDATNLLLQDGDKIEVPERSFVL
ncbi:MAG TPA: hypothetical protein VHH73_05145 [Verrucomicrobiae bacterium]|nr:hypothetical protein [Verrucomicrobiae bacterium]